MVFSKIPSSVPSYSVQVAQPQPIASPYISSQPIQAIPAQEPSTFDTIVSTVKEIPSKVKTFFVGGEELKKKWNRTTGFLWHKKTKTRKGHPAYVFAKNRRQYKFFCFTHSPKTDGSAKN